MPSALIPHASASHRVACIHLYRALLKQTSLLQICTPGGSSDALPCIVQYRFRKDRKLVSPTQVANGLNAGYAILDLVEACNNKDGEALKRLAHLAESITAQAESKAAWRSILASSKSPPTSRKLAEIEHVKAVTDKANHCRHTASKSILERPLPLSEIRGGNRRVPNLVNAQGIPFLRYSKPQPISLSRVIRQRIKWNEKSWTQRGVLQQQIIIAEREDEWDGILREEHGVVEQATTDPFLQLSEPSWADEFQTTDRAIFRSIRAKDAKYAEMGRRMWDIVIKEQALKRQEKIERRAARKEMRATGQDAVLQGETEHFDVGPLWASSTSDGQSQTEAG